MGTPSTTMKTATPIPPEITAPDSVDTRLGTAHGTREAVASTIAGSRHCRVLPVFYLVDAATIERTRLDG